MTKIEGAIWNKNLEHEGIQISFNGKPSEEIRSKMKKAGFRWSGIQKVWYAKGYYGYSSVIAEEIATYGGEIGEPLSIEEKVEQKLERADARAERYEERAEKAKATGESLITDARKMADIIPFGQPILVGHYSEKGDRAYRGRIDNKFRKGFDTLEKAKYYEQRAESSSKAEDRLFNTGTVLRRIKKLESQWRYEAAYLTRTAKNKETGLSEGVISRKYMEGLEAIMEKHEHEIAYWKKAIEEHGGKVWAPEDFAKGDRVVVRGSKATIGSVNKKTITVKYDTGSCTVLTEKF
ncbi:MAG: DUF3560 domain-containing protein [Methanothrix sp.]